MPNKDVMATADSATQFFDTLQAQQQQAFGGNQAALSIVSNAWAPVAQSGAIPYGYSPGLDALLKSNIIDTGAAATANAQNAADLRLKQESGGASVLPSATQEALKDNIAATGQQATAKNLAAEKEAGYQQGVTNLKDLTSSELGIASGEDETGLGSNANSAGGLALNAGKEVFNEAQATGPLAMAGSIIGDIGGAVGDITGIGDVASMFKQKS